MHVAMIMDDERLLREHLMLNRLAIGLLNEGVRLTRIVPEVLGDETIGMGEERIALAQRVEVPLKVLPWMRKTRTARLIELMERHEPDVMYCVGERAWPIGIDLAKELDKAAAIGVWAARLIRRVPRGRQARTIGGYLASTSAIGNALRERVDPDLVATVPMGVAIPSSPRHVLTNPEQSVGIAVIGSGRDMPAYRAVLGGLKRVINAYPQIHIFLELRGPHAHEVWRYARHLEMLDHVSSIREAAQHRPLLTRCDIMLLPERYGEPSSLLLESMALGVPIIAADDVYLDMLIADQSAIIVPESNAETWARQIGKLLSDPASARGLGLGGREIVSRHCSSVLQIDRLIETLERIVRGGAYPFGHPRATQSADTV